jgi:hypothetical protein
MSVSSIRLALRHVPQPLGCPTIAHDEDIAAALKPAEPAAAASAQRPDNICEICVIRG